ncbi:MAG: PAS domain S-box protein [Syntrophomonas sp.]
MNPERHSAKSLLPKRHWTVNRLQRLSLGPLHSYNPTPVRPSLEFYFGILMTSPHPISIFTKEGVYVDVNAAWLKTTGYRRREVLGRHVDEINIGDRMDIQRQETPEAQSYISEFLEPKMDVDIWITVIKSRVIQWVSFIQADGITNYIVSRGFDITRQLEMENNLQERNAELSSIFADANSLIFTADANGTLLFISPGWQKMLGYDASEVEGKTLEPFLHPDDIDLCRAFFKKLVAYEEPVRFEYRIRHRDGSWRWHMCSGGMAKSQAGKVLFFIGIATDVTEKKQVEQALLKSEEKFSKAFNANPDAITITTWGDGRYIDVNEAFLSQSGWTREEVVGRTVREMGSWITDQDRDHILGLYRQQGHVQNAIVNFRNKYGVIRTCDYSGVLVDMGYETYIVAIIKDVHELKQANEALKLSEEKFSKAFNVNPDNMSITSIKEGRYVDVNDAFLRKTGWQRDEIVGHTVSDINIWANPRERDYVLQNLRENGYVVGTEVNFRMKSGEIRTGIFSAVIIDVAGEEHLLVVTKDIHDLKLANEALRLSEDKFSKAFHSSPTPMSISTMEEGRFIDVNETFCRVVGYERQEMLGRTAFDLQLWIDSEIRTDVKEKLLRGELVRNFEVYFRLKSGEERIGLYSAESTSIDGQLCLLSILTDITAHKQAEEEIRYLSFHDKLTGLYNRAYFEEELRRLDTARQLPLSIIMGDVNGLKLINDALGHQEGDKLLITVADALKEACRAEDILARWGGDEFIILLPGCPHSIAAGIVDRIKSAETIFHTLPIQTSISLGTATKTRSDEDIRSIIKEAEDKMYRNKLLENKSTRSYFLSSLERTLWSRSHETKEHCERIKKMAMQIGEYVRLPGSEMDSLRLLAALHDIGKIAISNSILEKPDKLSAEEWEAIRKHPEVGYRIALSSPEMAPIAEAILHHHERWDGRGYPLGLMGKDIPFLSRIISIVDAYDVMTHGRPYQAAISSEDAWREIIRQAGSQFDPDLVNIISSLNFESDWK